VREGEGSTNWVEEEDSCLLLSLVHGKESRSLTQVSILIVCVLNQEPKWPAILILGVDRENELWLIC